MGNNTHIFKITIQSAFYLRFQPPTIKVNEKAVHPMLMKAISCATGPEVKKLFFMLSSTEHKISTAHKN